jgi:hypothetical protein
MDYIETAQQNKIVEQNFPNERNKVLFMSEQKNHETNYLEQNFLK